MLNDFLNNTPTIYLAILATTFTWLATLLGASVVFFLRKINRNVLNAMLGFAAGIMIAASIWSLIEPAFEYAEQQFSSFSWVPVTIGFLLGTAFIYAIDKILPHLHLNSQVENKEGIKTDWNRTTLLVLAITLHNIPEGLAVGVVFASIANSFQSDFTPAIMLTIGMAIQNIPEGAAVSLPLRGMGNSRWKSFFWGQFSGFVEILSAIIGVSAVLFMTSLLPYALAFAAGAMIYVVIEELIPQSQIEGNTDISTLGAITGFTLMMILDNVL